MNLDLNYYIEGFKNKDVAVLARAITLVESENLEHQKFSLKLLSELSALKNKNSFIIGISGTPGVGKSTFIESLGLMLLDQGVSLCVLAVDPSSEVTGGSILGDKTRMTSLSQRAFIRPSPSGSHLGGVAHKTKEAIFLCEVFGFDYILVETVGVGQSEAVVSKMVDFFLLLMQPGSGDDLQAIKRGILELADMIIVNKADGELLNNAKRAQKELELSLSILRNKSIKVMLVSALKSTGLDDVMDRISKFFKDNSKDLLHRRLEHEKQMIQNLLNNFASQKLLEQSEFKKFIINCEKDIRDKKMTLEESLNQIEKILKSLKI